MDSDVPAESTMSSSIQLGLTKLLLGKLRPVWEEPVNPFPPWRTTISNYARFIHKHLMDLFFFPKDVQNKTMLLFPQINLYEFFISMKCSNSAWRQKLLSGSCWLSQSAQYSSLFSAVLTLILLDYLMERQQTEHPNPPINHRTTWGAHAGAFYHLTALLQSPSWNIKKPLEWPIGTIFHQQLSASGFLSCISTSDIKWVENLFYFLCELKKEVF